MKCILQRYLTEFDFRYNKSHQGRSDDTERAKKALIGIRGKRLMYRGPDEARH